MTKEEIIIDTICQVLVQKKSKELIYSILNHYIPNYEKINLDYTGKPDDMHYVFSSEDEMLQTYIDASDVAQTFYWNSNTKNPNKIMVGVNITSDNQMVISLTFNGTETTCQKYYLGLKNFLNSNIGIISYIDPADYEDGLDFKEKFETIIYDFEK